MSPPEVRLWNALRGRQIGGYKFRRQHPFEPYTLDFYCPELKLCIEVDGAQHGEPDQERRDARRDAYLSSKGVRVLRILAIDVFQNMDGVIQAITDATT